MPSTTNRGVLVVAILGGLVCQAAYGAGFAVHGQSTSQMGNAFAGVSASALDASTVWWNPAGMTWVDKTQGVVVNHLMRTSTQFDNEASIAALGQPLGSEGGDAGTFRITGALYGQYKLTPAWTAGLGVNFPFGLRTVYEGDWMGRFQAQKSESKALNINPSIAYKPDQSSVSIGAGINFQRFEATLTNAVNYSAAVVNAATQTGAITAAQVPALLNPLAPGNIAGLEGKAIVSGDDWGVGWNVGILYRPTKHLSLGAHYRSRIRYTLDGQVEFTAPATTNPLAASAISALGGAGGPLSSGPVSARFTVPDTLSLSAVATTAVRNRRLDLLFDATWFGWSSLSDIAFRRANGTLLNRLDFQWRDTWRLAAGATYWHSDDLQLRVGYAWDQTVIDDERTRSPRLPDSTRHWFSLGSRHTVPGYKNITVDSAVNFTKGKNARMLPTGNLNSPATGVLNGRFRTNSLTLSAQLNWAFE